MAEGTTIKLGLDASEVKKGEAEFTASAQKIESAARAMGKTLGGLTTLGNNGKSWVDTVTPTTRQAEKMGTFTNSARQMAQVAKELGNASRAMQGANIPQAAKQIGDAYKQLAEQLTIANRQVANTDLSKMKEWVTVAKQAVALTRQMQAVNGAKGQAAQSAASAQRVQNQKLILQAAVTEEAATKRSAATGQQLLAVTQQRVRAYEQLKAMAGASVANTELRNAQLVAQQEMRRVQIVEQRRKAEEAAAAAATKSAQATQTATLQNAVQATQQQLTGALTYTRSLQSMQYAAQELRNQLTLVTAAVTALSGAFVHAAASQERAFADVARTTRLPAEYSRTLRELSNELQSLSANDLTTTYEDLSAIASLGAQMDIPAERLADFTEAVGGFVAITDVSVDEASAAFGRIVNTFQQAGVAMNGDVTEQYSRLASQIAELGTKSVSTESEILKMTQSIGASAVSVGMDQDAVLAYSAALTSVGIKAEWARGSLQRIFGKINASAADGVQEMEKYAKVMGITAEEADRLWRTDSSKFFNDMIYSLNNITDKVEQAKAVSEMGFVNVRDVQLMQRLSVNAGLLAKAMSDSEEAGKSSKFLGESLDTINNTLEATVQRFRNSFANMAATFGEPFLNPIKLILEGLNKVMQTLKDIGETPAGRVFAAMAGGVTIFAALSAGAKTLQFATLNVIASYMRMREQLAQVGVSGPMTWKMIASATQQANAGVKQATVLYAQLDRQQKALAANQASMRLSNAAGGVSNTGATTANGALAVASTRAAQAQKDLAASSAMAGTAIKAQGAAAAGAAVSTGAATAATGGLTVAAGGLRAALTALNLTNPVGWVMTAVSLIPAAITVYDEFANAAEKAAQKAAVAAQDTLATLGGNDSLLNALKKDTEDYAAGVAGSYADLTVAVGSAGSAAEDSADQWYYWINAQGEVVTATMETARAQGLLAVKVGEATKSLIADSLMASEAFQNVTADQLRTLSENGFDWGEYANVAAASANGAEAAQQYVNGFISQIDAKISEINNSAASVNATGERITYNYTEAQKQQIAVLEQQKEAFESVNESVLNVGGAFDLAAQQQLVYAQIAGDNTDATDDLTDSLSDNADAWDDAVSAMKSWIDEAFGSVNATASLYEALDALNQSVYDNGTSFDAITEEGRANLEALQAYLQAVVEWGIAAAEQMGLTGAEAQQFVHEQVQAAIDSLAAEGFDLTGIEDAMTNIQNTVGSDLSGPTIDTSGFDQTLVNMQNNAVTAMNNVQSTLNAGAARLAGGTTGGSYGPYATGYRLGGGTNVVRRTAGSASGTYSRSNTKKTANTFANSLAKALSNYTFTPKSSSGNTGSGGRSGGSGSRANNTGSRSGNSGSGSGSRSGSASANKKTAAEEFEDYLSRLSSAMSSALKKFWQVSDANDAYHSQLNTMRKNIKNTKDNIASLGKEIANLTQTLKEQQQELADKQYFRAIAKKYGDTERVKSLDTDISGIQNNIKETQESIKTKQAEQAELKKTIYALTGYSDAAIANRAALKQLQSTMVEMIQAYAAQGHSTQEVAAYTEKLKQEFINQATQMGFNKVEVTRLAGAFTSLIGTIKSVPRTTQTTVTDNGSAGRVSQAIDNAARPRTATITVRTNNIGSISSALVSGALVGGALGAATVRSTARGITNVKPRRRAHGGAMPRYADGGYVLGNGGGNQHVDTKLAWIRPGEYIVRKSAVDYYGKGLLESINRSRFNPIQVTAPSTGGQVTLDPNQLVQLARAVSSVVQLDGRAISGNVNKQYAVTGKRGSY